jgi:hypothetical protein
LKEEHMAVTDVSALPDDAPVPAHLIRGHLGRLGTRHDVKLHQQYIAPVIEKYTGVLAAADVFTAHTALWLMESIRLDLGVGSQVHP